MTAVENLETSGSGLRTFERAKGLTGGKVNEGLLRRLFEGRSGLSSKTDVNHGSPNTVEESERCSRAVLSCSSSSCMSSSFCGSWESPLHEKTGDDGTRVLG